MYEDQWLLIDGVPTRLLTWGSNFEQLQENQHLILMIPGNPGIADFYIDFLTKLHEEVKIPVWIISHAGHDLPPIGWSTKTRKMEFDEYQLYDLKQQVDHKMKIIEKLRQKHCKLHVIGHSMGAKIVLDLLKSSQTEKIFEKCYLLFPTIEHIGDTPNAQFIKPFIKYFASTVIFLSWIFTLLPSIVKDFLLRFTFTVTHGGSNQCTTNGGKKLIHPLVLKNIFHLTKDEMNKIKELDLETLQKFKTNLKFYYGTTDGWSPLKFYDHLMKEIPDIDAEVCNKGIKHAFTIKSAAIMSSMISNWINTSLHQ